MTTWPAASVPLFPAGYGPFPADLTAWITDNFGFLAQGPLFRAVQTTGGGQALTSGFNVVAYNSVLEDPYSGWNATTHAWTAPVTGLYEVTICGCVNGASIWVGGAVQVSGGNAIQGSSDLSAAAVTGGGLASVLVPLTGGSDFVQGGFAVSAAATTDTSSAGRQPSMEISLVSL